MITSKDKKPKLSKRIKEVMISRPLIGSVLFAIALWVYTSLNGDYITIIKVPLSVNLPENRILEAIPEKEISVKVSGTGWQIFNLLFFSSSKNCVIDLTDVKAKDDYYTVTRNDILNGVQGMINVEPMDVFPYHFDLKTGLVKEHFVKVLPRVSITPREGFMIIGDIKVEPDSIIIRGSDKTIAEIRNWPTVELDASNVYESLSVPLALLDTLKGTVEISETKVTISANIQQLADITVDDVKVQVRNGANIKGHLIDPQIITVVIRGGVDQLSDFSPESVSAYIDLADLKTDSTGILIPKIIYPDSLTLVGAYPEYVYHYVIAKSLAVKD